MNSTNLFKAKGFFAVIILLLIQPKFLHSQGENHWIFFTDKDGVDFDPLEYFDPKAIERRIINHVDLYHFSDFPVRQDYIAEVKNHVTDAGFASRWFNAISVSATDAQIEHVRKLPFVKEIQSQEMCLVLCEEKRLTIGNEELELAKLQIELMQGGLFKEHGLTGKGIRIAVFDGGFPNVDTHPAFFDLRLKNRIIKTRDFTRKRDNVYGFNAHGLMVLSNICGHFDDIQLGLATDAEFLLARTEVAGEPKAEEAWWLEAAEWADRHGAQIINSSLGYGYHRYFPENMDGKTSLVSRAANMAASKGIIVVNAMGNEGDKKSWKVLITPADADSVLSVGGVDPKEEIRISFSSFGPTADGRRKPNVTNSAHVAVASRQLKIETAFGTSFATPLTSGFVACAMQSRPETPAMEMIKLIEQSGNLYPYYDYVHGYGIPQASFFTTGQSIDSIPAFSFEERGRLIEVRLDDRRFPNYDGPNSKNMSRRYLYYHIESGNGILIKYGVVELSEKIPFSISRSEIPENGKLRVACLGTVLEWTKTNF